MENRKKSKRITKRISNEIDAGLSKFYDQHAEKKKGITVGKVLEEFEELGILPVADPRMKDFMQFISAKGCKLTKQEFIKAVGLGDEVLTKAICRSLAISDFKEFKSSLQDIFNLCKSDNRGCIFQFNPSVPKVNPDAWEAALFTISGRVAHFGSGQEKFTMQSVIKPIIYALALELLGVDVVTKIVGMSYHYGRTTDINSLNEKGIPKNAVINSGGIAICSYIRNVALKNLTKAQVFDYVLQFLKDLAGNKYVSFSNITYMAEKEAMTRNKCLIYYLRQKKCLAENADINDLYFYFATCSFEVTVESLSLMGATIANYGTNPITGKEVLKEETCKYTMAMMQYCTPTPSWLRDVGLPAAKGASGAFLVILPRLFSLCMFSPKIDDFYCNYRSKDFCKAFVHRYRLNMFNVRSQLDETAEEESVKVVKPCQWNCGLYNVAATGTAVDLASMLTHDAKPCQVNYLRRNLLHDAAAAGNLTCVSFFMQLCPHMLEKKDCMGFTPIDDAKFFNHGNVVEYLEKWISLKTGSPTTKKE